MVVDDDFMVAKIHAGFGDRVPGFTVAGVAHSGADALRLVDDVRPDLVLLDLIMPKMDGLAFLRALRGRAPHRDLPVIVLTALPESSQLDQVRGMGGCDLLPKARFTVEDLLARIRARVSGGGSGAVTRQSEPVGG